MSHPLRYFCYLSATSLFYFNVQPNTRFMKKNYAYFISYLVFTMCFCSQLKANTYSSYLSIDGDTTFVQTFRFDSTMRSGMFQFPTDTTKTYEKILMLYSMRCHNGLVSTSAQPEIGCGQWDYNCNTYLVDSTQSDSLKKSSANYLVDGFSDSVLTYTQTPVWNFIQTVQHNITYTNTLSENISTVGSSTSTLTHPLSTSSPLSRNQYLWTAAELTSNGLSAGNITGIALNLSSLGSNISNLRIRIKTTNQTALNSNSPELTGFTEVYYLNTNLSVIGLNRFNFYTPFNWNGTSNIILEYSYTNSSVGTNHIVNGSSSSFVSALTNSTPDSYIDLNGGISHAKLPSTIGNSISNKITISFWCFGNPTTLPKQTIFIEGVDASNNRSVNIHLPWSDGSIYWDCGGDAIGYDRINKAATANEMKGRWNYWVFTKDATTGSMKIYLNGVLWQSGTGKTRPINIYKMQLGLGLNSEASYDGSIDELCIWDTELSQATIQANMYHSITPLHPNYSNLKFYLPFNEGSGNVANDLSANAGTATLTNATWQSLRGHTLFRNFTESSERPNTSFIKGVYTSVDLTSTVLDSFPTSPSALISYSLNNGNLETVDTTYVWMDGTSSYTYDGNGNAINSSLVIGDDSVQVSTLNYYEKRPMKLELINFITPYGIGLDMNGLNGRTWQFDVTDFAPALKGSKFMAMENGRYQEDNDITFAFIEGTPPRDVKSIASIWPNASWTEASYQQILNDTYFEPRSITLSSNASMFKLKSSISGHGQEGEFISRVHFIKLNNLINFSRAVWKECATNPIYPQGGTWVYDRAGWCPGSAVDTKEFEITPNVSPGQTITLDHSLPVVTNFGTSNYRISNLLVSYGPANFSLDASIAAIKTPSERTEFTRFNAICNEPIITIKNTGSSPLTSLTITYGRENGTMSTYTWTGSLAFLASTDVTLPQPNWLTSNVDRFIAIVSNPNGSTDQYSQNDTLTSTFKYPSIYPSYIIFELKTNTLATQTSYTLKDSQGNIIITRSGLAANTIYRDTVNLPTDCYAVSLNDAGDDGLSWWANTSQGTGYFRIRNAATNAIIKTYNPDFGDNIYEQFTVNYALPVNEIQVDEIGDLAVYPNPTSNEITASFNLPINAKAKIKVVNMVGQTILTEDINVSDENEKVVIDVQNLSDGLYYVILETGNLSKMKKIIVNHSK